MKISTILDHIDNGHIALPEFQAGFKCFTAINQFKAYVENEILAEGNS